MTDRELLELAAKAAGIGPLDFDYANREGHGCYLGPRLPMREGVFMAAVHTYWNPLTYDGDALRLAVKLGIEHRRPSRSRSVGRVVQAWFPADGNPARSASSHVSIVVGGDVLAATRRAIVRAAAEIGGVM